MSPVATPESGVPWTDGTVDDMTQRGIDHNSALEAAHVTQAELDAVAAGDVDQSLYDANTIVKADSDNTPVAMTVAASRIVGRGAAGGIAALTPAQVKTILGVEDLVTHTAGEFVQPSTGEPFPDRYITKLVTGAAAGDVTVAGIRPPDEIESVINLTDLTDLTAEFDITATDTINNTGGTSTAAKVLEVRWHRRGYELTGLAFDNVIDEKAAMPLYAPASWPSVNIGMYYLASSFGSGTVRLENTANSTIVDLAVTAGGVATVFPNVAFAAAGALGQSQQFSMRRVATATEDNLAERFCVLAVYLTPGV